ncbi:hypothetical protein SVAN01_00806 [Stagonosporopsis vannaccii]|nr:hypothetical protein SVAN01_00806 [Stagonosporopsis vannaccii]
MQAFVPKNRRPKFDLQLRIVDLNNVPLTSGKSFVKWHLPHSTAAEHRGKTDHCPIIEHKVQYDYDATLPVRLTVDKNGMLQESFIEFEVVQEYASSGRGERITLGNVKLNLAEYVEQSEFAAAEGDELGVTRRYLMQNSKINSTLKLGIYMRQTEGDKNFIAPALKTAQVFSGIAGIMAGEQAELEDSGAAPSLTSKSRDASELQDMYRRTLAAYWSAQPGELKADECIEDIFAGGDGWGDRAKPYSPQRSAIRFTTTATGDSSTSVSGDERHTPGNRRLMRKSQDTLRPGSTYSGSPKQHVRGRGSLEQQAHHMKAEAERKRHRPHHEVDDTVLTFLSQPKVMTRHAREFARAVPERRAELSGRCILTTNVNLHCVRAAREPPSSFASVCLRCELKLARPRTYAHPRPPSYASFCSSVRRHDAADEAQALAPSEPPGQEDNAARSLRISREYIRKGKIVRQRKAKLGMRRMDEDADVLVLNTAPVHEEPEKTEPEVLEPISVPDILSSLQQDSAPATQEDVEKQLESLRPTRGNTDEPQYVTTADFVKLVAALTRGFTTAQLSGYYSTATKIKKKNVTKVLHATTQATIRSNWHPTTTDIQTRLPGVEASIGRRQKPRGIRKATLVDKILRDVWKLELLEELEAPGELELRLKEWQLKLLQTGGNDSVLARIARVRNAKAEIHWPTKILRITADKTTAEYTANDVEAALSKARTKTLKLNRWTQQLDNTRLARYKSLIDSLPADFVSSLTATDIATADEHTLIIHGLDESSVAEAKRTLERLLPFKESATRTIDTQRLDAAKNGSFLMPVFHESTSLDFQYRDLSLGRWTLPVARSVDQVKSGGQPSPQTGTESGSDLEKSSHAIVNRVASLMKPPIDSAFTGPESKPRNRQTGYWGLEPQYKVSADFGQALFPLELSDPNKVAEAAADSSRSPFQPALPGLGSLLASSDFNNLSRTETPSLLYDFLPCPEQDDRIPAIGPDFPKLFVQVRTGRDGNKPTIHKLSIGFQQRIHDVLLPDQAIDIRFFRYGRLRFSSKSHHDKNVESWLEAVCQNIESGGRLSAPSLTIDIPMWTIPGFPSDAIGMLPVKYLFSGIQFRQSVTGTLLDTQVSYSTIQSGKLGAKGGSLSAYSETLDTTKAESQIREFASKCVQMVDYITQAGAQTQPPRQAVLPRNEHSARKQRRAALRESQNGMLNEGQILGGELDDEITPAGDLVDHQEADIRLASRLDDAAPTAEAKDALNEAEVEVDEDKRDAKAKAQRQEADALLEDLFGDKAAMETADKHRDEIGTKSECEKN